MGEVIYVHSLIEVNLIQFMKNVKIINYMKVSDWMLPGVIVLYIDPRPSSQSRDAPV